MSTGRHAGPENSLSTCRVGIIGAGTMGLVSLLVATARSTPEIAVADLAAERLPAADRLGAHRTGPQLDGEFDLVIDAVGASATRAASVEHVRPGGAAVWIGLDDEDPGFAAMPFIRAEKAVHGTFCYTHADFDAAVRLALTIGTSWVTVLPMSEGISVFEQLMNGRTDLTKVHLTP